MLKKFLMSTTCRLEELLLMKKPAFSKAVACVRQSTSKMTDCQSGEKRDAPVRLVGNGSRDRRRYACLKCPYATDRRDLFTRHENIHRDEKPFRCYICNKMFNRADHVKKHFLRIHKGLDYDVKLTKRIKGVDYVDAENLPVESGSSAGEAANAAAALSDTQASSSAQSHFASHLVSRLIDTNQLLNSTTSSHPVCLSAFDAKSQLIQFSESGRSDDAAAISSPFSPFQVDGINKLQPSCTTDSESGVFAIQTTERKAKVCERNDRVSVDTELEGRPDQSEARDDETSTLSSPSPTLSASSRSSRHELPKYTQYTASPDCGSSDRVTRGSLRKGNSDDRSRFSVRNHKLKSQTTSSTQDDVRLSNEHECEVCGCAFADFPSLHTHRYLLHRFVPCSKHTHVFPYLCALCGHHSLTQKSMINHMSKHYARGNPVEDEDGTCVRWTGGSGRRKQVMPRKVVKT